MMSRALTLAALFLAAASPALAQQAVAKKLRAACAADAKALCADVEPGGGRILQCLKTKQDQVSKDCLAAIEDAQAARAAGQAQ
ncbi:hypothetical protein [Zavarzinia sp.]|uniref:hypothetical protein n=1 Tax=Zavarzinia sp. TaxID=2027920 RepID=UPI003BB6EA0C